MALITCTTARFTCPGPREVREGPGRGEPWTVPRQPSWDTASCPVLCLHLLLHPHLCHTPLLCTYTALLGTCAAPSPSAAHVGTSAACGGVTASAEGPFSSCPTPPSLPGRETCASGSRGAVPCPTLAPPPAALRAGTSQGPHPPLHRPLQHKDPESAAVATTPLGAEPTVQPHLRAPPGGSKAQPRC